MGDLKETIKGYLEDQFLRNDQNELYFGVLSELSADQRPDEKAIMMTKDDTHSGYLILNYEKEYHEVSYTGEE